MKKRFYIVVLLQFLLIALVGAQEKCESAEPDSYMEGSQFLSGKLTDAEGRPLANKELLLASVIKPFYYGTSQSESDGSFSFELPRVFGAHEFYLRTGFAVPHDAQITIYKREARPEPEEQSDSASLSFVNTPFYGSPDRIIYPSDYIELRSIEEFFFELVKEVGISRENGQKQLFLHNKQGFTGAPALILLDNIPIPNDEALLKLSSKRIQRMELITDAYVIGEKLYGGILALYSKNSDFAGYKFNGNSHFFTY